MRRFTLIIMVAVLVIVFEASTGTTQSQKRTARREVAANKEFSPGAPEKEGTINAFMAEKIIGSKVRNMKGEDLGTIEDIVIDIDTGRVLYAVVHYGGFLGIGGKLFPVPWQSLAPLPAEGIFFLDVSKAKLKDAPGYEKENLPDMGDTHWGKKVTDFYSAPGKEHSYHYDFGWGYGLGMYPHMDPFAKIFDAESIKEISGEVIKVERVIPKVGFLAPVQIKLIVLVARKEPVSVYLGPSWYVAGSGGRIPFKSGDSVTVTGSWITSQTEEPFMIALQVSKGDSSFRLRQKDGTPIWSGWKSGRN
jgi:sporulation protein YlmC with PRC-barrel domain